MLAWQGAFQRNKTYTDAASNKKRSEFKKDLIEFLLSAILPEYQAEVNEKRHLENIEKLRQEATKIGFSILHKSELKFGTAQKLLNLILKYYWCFDWITDTPPHCPIDNIILQELKIKRYKGKNWTDRDFGLSEYMSVVNAIKNHDACKGMSIAQCELEVFKRR